MKKIALLFAVISLSLFPLFADSRNIVYNQSFDILGVDSVEISLVVLIRLSPPEKLEQVMFPLEADKERFLAEPASIRILPLLACTESFPVWT